MSQPINVALAGSHARALKKRLEHARPVVVGAKPGEVFQSSRFILSPDREWREL